MTDKMDSSYPAQGSGGVEDHSNHKESVHPNFDQVFNDASDNEWKNEVPYVRDRLNYEGSRRLKDR